jgi:hypothetical protein
MGKILLPEGAAPATPASGYTALGVNASGDLCWAKDNGNDVSIVATSDVALTIAASGIAALGNDGAATWTPVITGSASNPTLTYVIQGGVYRVVRTSAANNIIVARFYVYVTAASGGSGDLRVSLPVAAAAEVHGGSFSNASLAGRNVVGAVVGGGDAFATLRYYSASNGVTATVACSDIPGGGGYLIGQLIYM